MEIWIGFTRIYDIQLSHCHLHMPPCCLRVWSLFSSDITTETWKGINEWLEQLNRTHWGDPLFALGIPVSHCLWSDLLDLKIVCVMEDPMSWHFGSHQPFFSRKKHLLFGGWFLNPQHAVTSKNRQPFNQRLFGETDGFSGGLPQSLPSFFPWGSCITKPITGGLPSLKPRFPGLTLANQRVGPLVFRHCAEKPVFSGRFKF